MKLAADRASGTPRGGGAGAVVSQDLRPMPGGIMAVNLRDERCVFAPIGADSQTVCKHVVAR